jgi:uncharacterized protein YjbI with pentapeptide repeats
MFEMTEGEKVVPLAAVEKLVPAVEASVRDKATDTQFLGDKARNLQSLRDAVVDAATVGGGLWVSYLFVLFYLLIAAGGVTHRSLLLENPVKLPFLGVDLPLISFFWLGPALFLVLHGYVLLNFVLLAGKIGDFDSELIAQITDDDVRTRLRRQLPNNIFVQFLAGSREIRRGIIGAALRAVAFVSLVLGPIGLLILFEFQFLPYHEAPITWWHRFTVVADIALLWVFWPAIYLGRRLKSAVAETNGPVKWLMIALSLVVIVLVVAVAVIPGEILAQNPGVFKWLQTRLVSGKVDFQSRRLESLWSNVLVLPDFDQASELDQSSESKEVTRRRSLSLRARHLEGAVLIGAKLAGVDFTGAHLQSVKLSAADLKGATFSFDCSGDSWGPNRFDECKTDMRAASLDQAQLQGANLTGAQLQGASFRAAQLQGANLSRAEMQGSLIYLANLEAADLSLANLEAAEIVADDLIGTSLQDADLRLAILANSQLQGADILTRQVQALLFADNYVWRSRAPPDVLNAQSLEISAIYKIDRDGVIHPNEQCPIGAESSTVSCNFSSAMFKHIQERLSLDIPKGEWLDAALRRLGRLDPDKEPEFAGVNAERWASYNQSGEVISKVHESQSTLWPELGCASEAGIYVILSFIRQFEHSGFDTPASNEMCATEAWRRKIAARFLDRKTCRGARALDPAAQSTLRKIESGTYLQMKVPCAY